VLPVKPIVFAQTAVLATAEIFALRFPAHDDAAKSGDQN